MEEVVIRPSLTPLRGRGPWWKSQIGFRLMGHAAIVVLGLAGGLGGWSTNVWTLSSRPVTWALVDEMHPHSDIPDVNAFTPFTSMAPTGATESTSSMLAYSQEEIAAMVHPPQASPTATVMTRGEVSKQASSLPIAGPTWPPTPIPPPARAITQQVPQATAVVPPPQPAVSEVVVLAMKLRGAPYVWGGNTPQGFDCAGFVRYIYGQKGIDLPRTLSGQLALGTPVERQTLEPGDLVFFQNTFERGLSHVGIYTGNGQFISAVSERRGVDVDSLDVPFWSERYLVARRP